MKRIGRFCALLLALCLMLPAFSLWSILPVHAIESDTRFIFSELESSNEHTYQADQSKPLVLDLFAHGTEFVCPTLSLVESNGSCNTLFVSLINVSNATRMRVSYRHTGENGIDTVEVELQPNSVEPQRFYLNTPNISRHASDLTIAFLADQTVEGSVTLESFCNFSAYQPNTQNDATMHSCRFDPTTQTIEIEGDVSISATVRYENASLALFALDPSEDIYLSNKTPVALIEFSSAFAFSVKVTEAEDIFARYVLAAVTAKGERIPLCAPAYPVTVHQTDLPSIGFKGFHANDTFAVLESGADLEIVDVYLDRLHDPQNAGILYVGDQSYYYFDEEYVAELDLRVRRLAGTGASVYLRFLISPDAADRPYIPVAGDVGAIVNKAITVENKDALYEIYALTDFLSSRYADDSVGKISGIIIGRSADRARTYNYSNASSLAEYTARYVAALQLIAGTARNNVKNLDVVVPLSDTVFSQTLSSAALNGDYYPEQFLHSLLSAMNDRSMQTTLISLMIESSTVPSCVREAENDAFGVDHLDQFMAYMQGLINEHPHLFDRIIYSWKPTADLNANELIAAYVTQYVSLRFNAAVRGFVCDLSLLDDQVADHINDVLTFSVQKINTQNTQQVTTPVLSLLGMDSLTQIAPAYSIEQMQNRNELELAFTQDGYQSAPVIKGSYTYWSFRTATSLLGWYGASLCEDLSVLSGSAGRSLTASLATSEGGEYAEIAYNFTPKRNFSFAPYISFTIGVLGTENTPYEVQVRLVGANSSVTSSVILFSKETETLFLDLSGYEANLASLCSVRILARPLDGDQAGYTLNLHQVTIESATLDDDALTRMIADQLVQDESDRGVVQEEKDYTNAIIVTALVVFVSLAVATLVVLQYRGKKGKKVFQNNSKESERLKQ